MKKFLLKTVSFALVTLLLLAAADIAYSKFVENSSFYPCRSWYDVMHGTVNAEVVAMGNSRAQVQISPAVLDSALQVNTYNLGMDGSPANRQVLKYRLFRKYNTKPRLIIQNIDYNTLTFEQGYLREQFMPFMWNPDFRREAFGIEHFSFAEKYVPMLRYHGYGPNEFLGNPNVLYKGYRAQDKVWDGTAYLQTDSISFIVSDTTATLFEQYLDEVQADGIKMVFVYAPIYIGATEKITNLQEMYSRYGAYAEKYGIPVLDYNYMDICYDTCYFYNAMHLNSTGAGIYSRKLAEDIKALGLLP